jgi:hypothetical protein
MRITGSYGWADGSSIDVIIEDEIEEFNAIRTSEIMGYTLDLLRKAITDREHANAEHDRHTDKPAEQ